MRNLKEVIFSITNRCNLKCRMCDIPLQKAGELPTEMWMKAIRDASLVGAQAIVFSGGEPLVRDDIFDLISFTKKNQMSACLTSNGQLLSDKVALELSRSGVNVVNISIEGDRVTHDYLRGDGAFNKAILGLSNLRKYKIEATVAATVSKYNYESLISVLELAKEHGATTLRFQPFSKIFLKEGTEKKGFFLEKDEIEKAQDIFEKIITLSDKYHISTNPVNYLRKIPFYLGEQETIYRNGCDALFSSCPINSKGDIFPCWVITSKENLIGNLKEKHLVDLWFSKRHENIKRLIIKRGCPGCMMSCYDEAFGADGFSKVWFRKMKNIDKPGFFRKLKNKFFQKIKSQITMLKVRAKFYKSYRGSFRKIIKRLFSNIQRKNKSNLLNNKTKMQDSLLEIHLCKKKIEKELSR